MKTFLMLALLFVATDCLGHDNCRCRRGGQNVMGRVRTIGLNSGRNRNRTNSRNRSSRNRCGSRQIIRIGSTPSGVLRMGSMKTSSLRAKHRKAFPKKKG